MIIYKIVQIQVEEDNPLHIMGYRWEVTINDQATIAAFAFKRHAELFVNTLEKP